MAGIRADKEVRGNSVLPFGQPRGMNWFVTFEVDADGRLVVAPTADMAGQPPFGVNVGVASTLIRPANPVRRALVLTNDSDTAIHLAIGQAAVVNRGIRLNAGGGSITISERGPLHSRQAIYAIHGGAGNKVLTGQEFE